MLAYDSDFSASPFSRAAECIAVYDVRAAGSARFAELPPLAFWTEQVGKASGRAGLDAAGRAGFDVGRAGFDVGRAGLDAGRSGLDAGRAGLDAGILPMPR